MRTIAELKAEAVSLGMDDSQIASYVVSQQKVDRDERAAERDLEREKLAAEERTNARDHELRLIQLRAQNPSVPNIDGASLPKLPLLYDGDDINSFFIRFERIAELLNIDPNTYAVRLGTLLTGKAVNIYAALPIDTIKDYNLLKSALLHGFNKTPENYRLEFRSLKVSPGETYEQFCSQLGRCLDNWLRSNNVTSTYESLRDFIIYDQFMASVSPDIRLFIKERNATALPEVVKLADNWSMARGGRIKRPADSKPKTKINDPKSDSSNARKPRDYSNVKCHGCGEMGHIKPKCPKNPLSYANANSNFKSSNVRVNFCLDDTTPREFMSCGTVNGSRVSTILRDTGCSCIIVADEILPDHDNPLRYAKIFDFLGRENSFPVVKCYIRCPFYDGWAEVVKAPLKFCSVLIGNVKGASKVFKNLNDKDTDQSVHAITRSSRKSKPLHPLKLPSLDPLQCSPEEFANLQESCPSLLDVRTKSITGESVAMKDNSAYKFVKLNNLYYRECVDSKTKSNIGNKALIVPSECRSTILSLAHESPLAGHFSNRKTEMRVRETFFWPGMGVDIKNYCKSCDRCQRLSPKGRVKNVPLMKMPIITEPFSRVAIDLVGPLSPTSSAGHRYVLTLIDFATGWSEAIALKDIDTIAVSEALLEIFSRVGIPKEILSDRGPQFTSQLMGELHRLLGVKPIFTSPYHPSGNGRIERVHSTLKSCLRKLCMDKPTDWHRYLVPTMFALREIPSDRSGFSAFELLYGRKVRGPLTVLRDLWEDSDLPDSERTQFQYVIELRDKLDKTAQLAAQNSEISATKFKSYFDLKSQDRQFAVGDEVLILLPDNTHKLLMAWSGPYKVIERRNRVNYLIDKDGIPKLFHANLLKRYIRRATVGLAYVMDEVSTMSSPLNSDPLSVCQCCVVEDYDSDCTNPVLEYNDLNEGIPTLDTTESGAPQFSNHLDLDHRTRLLNLIGNYSDVFTPIPGCTSAVVHDICLTTTEPFRAKVYPIPINLQPHFEEEVDKLLALGIIRPSNSPFRSPTVMVKKSCGSYRMTTDFRALNAVTEFHAEPACSLEEDLHKFATCNYFSELDLSKAYYQICLTERSKPLTAFATHRGLMEYNRLPFGLVTACATYARLMRVVLADLKGVTFYFDNVLIYSDSFSDHLKSLEQVLQRLKIHNLTVQPSKCHFGFKSLEYLGFIIGEGNLKPVPDKLDAIINLDPPTKVKPLRSFLGLVSFYRKFIHNLADMTAPMSDMLRKGVSEPLKWSETAVHNFNKLKSCLLSEPVLKLPDTSLTFVLRTDASNFGLGAILLQYHDDLPFPVSYASRKLLDREKRYSAIERECLSIVFGVDKFRYYLLGKEFLLEVDHRPLIYLNKLKGSNARLMRWALCLQPYRFRIVYVPGKDNLGADLLSRS